MLTFQPVTLADIDTLRPFFAERKGRACDYTVGGTLLWRDFFSTAFALWEETLLFRHRHVDGNIAFSMPLGRNVAGALKLIRSECREAGIPCLISFIEEEDLAVLREEYQVIVCEERDWFDYLYRAEDLGQMTGRRYNGQRNHMNAFKKENPDWFYAPLDGSTLGDVSDFFARFRSVYAKESAAFWEELEKTSEFLENLPAYGMVGTVLYRAPGAVAAFSAGEVVGDTLYAHIEKADHTIRGSYQMIASGFVRMHAGEGVAFVNREDDSGDEGLRRSKLSYHPERLIPKYTATLL